MELSHSPCPSDVATRVGLLLWGTGAQPASARTAIDEIAFEDRDLFLGVVIRWLLHAEFTADTRRMLAEILTADPVQLDRIAEAKALTPTEARLVLQTIDTEIPGISGELLTRAAPGQVSPQQAETICRLLSLVESAGLADRNRMIISSLASSSNPKVRAHAVSLVLRATSRTDDAMRMLSDPDGRVQANIVEALWPLAHSSNAQGIFREHVSSPVARVATNCLIGMHLGGDPEAAVLLARNLRGSDLARSRAAAWAMGFLGEESFVQTLEDIRQRGPVMLRGAALRALVSLRAGGNCTIRPTRTSGFGAVDVHDREDQEHEMARDSYCERESAALEQLAKGAPEWNQWRRSGDGLMPDLNGASLANRELAGFDFSFCGFRDADLRGAQLSFCSFFGADLRGTCLRGASLNFNDLRATEIDDHTDMAESLTHATLIDG